MDCLEGEEKKEWPGGSGGAVPSDDLLLSSIRQNITDYLLKYSLHCLLQPALLFFYLSVKFDWRS